jgi:nitroreductase
MSIIGFGTKIEFYEARDLDKKFGENREAVYLPGEGMDPKIAIDEFLAFTRARRSVRAYTSGPVTFSVVRKILESARTAPSGANLQPGQFIVLTGTVLHGFCYDLCAAIEGGLPPSESYSYFPDPMPRHLVKRQVEVGARLYAALRVDRADKAGRHAQFIKNYRFFDAPVGIIVTIDRTMGSGCFMDMGMALQNLFLAAHAEGLASCGIGAMANYGSFIAERLGIGDDRVVICGIALGYADWEAAVNNIKMDRLPVEDYVRFDGWEPALSAGQAECRADSSGGGDGSKASIPF